MASLETPQFYKKLVEMTFWRCLIRFWVFFLETIVDISSKKMANEVAQKSAEISKWLCESKEDQK